MRLFNRNPLDWDTLSPGLRVLILVNLGAFVLQWIVGPTLIELFGLVPYRVIHSFWLWQPLTYMFLHGGVLHIFFNMIMLWMFGTVLESAWGPREFLKYYFICGLGAAVASILLGWNSWVPTIGASGAIFGLLTAFAMAYPNEIVYVWFFIPMTARTMAIVFGVLELLLTTGQNATGISSIAHLGGMVTGYLYLRYGWAWRVRLHGLGRSLSSTLARPALRSSRRRSEPEEREDDIEGEVNRILDKVLVQGAGSLTPEERELMRRYAKRQGKGVRGEG